MDSNRLNLNNVHPNQTKQSPANKNIPHSSDIFAEITLGEHEGRFAYFEIGAPVGDDKDDENQSWRQLAAKL